VPPLIFERRRFLDRSRNPFFEHGEAEYFLARRDGRAVGRITAQVDHALNEFQGENCGLFGFFESVGDGEVATALLGAAETWLRERGCERVVGPMDFSLRAGCGLLVDGFDRDPVVLANWTHPYYPQLLESAGYTKAVDVLMWELQVSDRGPIHPATRLPARDEATAHTTGETAPQARREAGPDITVRHMRKRALRSELERFREVYNAAWTRNWGFVPLGEAEVRHYAKVLRPVLDEDWAWVAETNQGEAVGVALAMLDYNQVLKRMGGRLLPFGWLKLLLGRRRIDRIRVFALGVKPNYQHAGIASRFYKELFETALRRRITRWEMGWILEVNESMSRFVDGAGGRVGSRYRLYQRTL
jgi:GNAT superfamily N-acetyltransferase